MFPVRRKGFTLIELVIVVAIIGILALMVIPQFGRVTEEAKVQTFIRNCKTVISGIGVWQASHDGDMPADTDELSSVINGGWASITSSPSGAIYSYSGDLFTASYEDGSGITHNYRYPQ